MNRSPVLKPQSEARQRPLPETAQVIEEVIGREATLKLAGVTKWRKLYVPVDLCKGHAEARRGSMVLVRQRGCTCSNHWTVGAIGADLALKLSKAFGGSNMDMPRCAQLALDERNERIREAYRKGAMIRHIAADYGLSVRAVTYITAPVNAPAKSKRYRTKRGLLARRKKLRKPIKRGSMVQLFFAL